MERSVKSKMGTERKASLVVGLWGGGSTWIKGKKWRERSSLGAILSPKGGVWISRGHQNLHGEQGRCGDFKVYGKPPDPDEEGLRRRCQGGRRTHAPPRLLPPSQSGQNGDGGKGSVLGAGPWQGARVRGGTSERLGWRCLPGKQNNLKERGCCQSLAQRIGPDDELGLRMVWGKQRKNPVGQGAWSHQSFGGPSAGPSEKPSMLSDHKKPSPHLRENGAAEGPELPAFCSQCFLVKSVRKEIHHVISLISGNSTN